MPIPTIFTDEKPTEKQVTLRLVGPLAVPQANFLLYPRALAHFVDVCIVQGFSLYSAKFFTVILLGFHAGAITASGKSAGPAFRHIFTYASTELFAASFAALAIVYFVALPMVMGRTLGLGLFGMRIAGTSGENPDMRQLVLRLLGCALNYASFGLLCLGGLRKRSGVFLHDELSGSRVVMD